MYDLAHLQQYMQKFISGCAAERSNGAASSGFAPYSNKDRGTSVNPESRPADVVGSLEKQAKKAEREALRVTQQAVDQLQLAGERIEELVGQREVAAACIAEARMMIRAMAEAMQREKMRAQAAEQRLRQLEPEATMAETLSGPCYSAPPRSDDAPQRLELLRSDAALAA